MRVERIGNNPRPQGDVAADLTRVKVYLTHGCLIVDNVRHSSGVHDAQPAEA